MTTLKADLRKFDHPIVFALSITFVVIGTMAVLSWAFMGLGWSGPLSVVKGGIAPLAGGPAPQ
jgi:hypothetical protein